MKIIIPTDFSESTRKALRFLSSFKLNASIEVDLLYIVSDANFEAFEFHRREWLSGKFKPFFTADQIDVITEICRAHNFINKIICKTGSLEKEILNEANSGKYQLLLSATHGIHSLKDIVFGNITQHLVNDSLIPVLSLPETYRISDSNKLLFVSNFNLSEKSNFGHLKMLTEKIGLELHLLKIVEEGNQKDIEIRSGILSYMNSNNLKFKKMHIKEDRTIEEGIHHFLEEFDISICAMATHARHGIKHFFLGSMTEQLVDKINVPLFTFRINTDD